MRAFSALILATVLFAACAGDGARQTPDATATVTSAPQRGAPQTPAVTVTSTPQRAGSVERDVVYCERDDIDLKMDVYYPLQESVSAPAVVYLHAGAWLIGDRGGVTRTAGFDELRARGYVIASAEYRLAPMWTFPAQIEDAMCAVRHLRANAERYGIDPSRIAAWGASSGGHLAALLGVAGDEAAFTAGADYEGKSNAVAAVVAMYAPADLEAPDFVSIAERAAREVFGAAGVGPSEELRRASPVTYVDAGDPPFLLIHGEHDQVVPLSQSQALASRLRDANVDAALIVVRNARHGLTPSGDEPISPSREDVGRAIADFLDRVMGSE